MSAPRSTTTRRIIGLTGGIGAGKSTVARLLAERGAHVIDVDQVCRDVIDAGGAAQPSLVDAFGADVVDVHGRLDRAALAAQVFSDPEALARLTSISHPAANTEMAREIDRLPEGVVVVLDMAVLAEYPALGRWPGGGADTVVVVVADEDVRLRRLVEQRGLTEADARARMANQMPDAERRRLADHVVDNSTSPDDLARQVEALAPALGLAVDGVPRRAVPGDEP